MKIQTHMKQPRHDVNVILGGELLAALQQIDLDGRLQDLVQLRGAGNFWASWCPPCVREMSSMQRLKEKLADRPFTYYVMAANMAEPDMDARAFLSRLKVDFLVPMDRDGAALQHRKVFVFRRASCPTRKGASASVWPVKWSG